MNKKKIYYNSDIGQTNDAYFNLLWTEKAIAGAFCYKINDKITSSNSQWTK